MQYSLLIAVAATAFALLCGNVCLAYKLRAKTRELEGMRAKAEHAVRLAAIGQMAGNVAHEINNPLTVIHGTVQQMLMVQEHGLLDADKFAKYADRVLQTTTRIAAIVRGLCTLSRNSDDEPLKLRPLGEIVTDTVALSSLRVAPRRIEVVVAEMEPNLFVKCRPVQISQVLLNLLNNAFDATSDVAAPRIELACVRQRGVIEIRVADNGAGIPPEVAPKIMQPYFTTKPSGKGTGLGLSVSSSIMKAHKGSLSFESAPGRTTFTMRLPYGDDVKQSAA